MEIAVSGTGVQLQDLGSSNGTWVNGRRVFAARLSSGDVVCAGSTVFVLSRALPLAQSLPLELGVVSCSPRMATVLHDLPVAAVRGCAVLLLGETGTGKGFLAHVLHRLSQRSGGPFVALNCATVPHELAESELFGTVRGAYTGAVARVGLVEAAQDGTLFLDEIGELPKEIQATLLGLLDNGEYRRLGDATNRCSNARMVAATNRANLASLLAGTLRPDLLARLSGETLVLPPLRLRREDIVPLTSAALGKLAKTCSCLTSEFVTGLLLHPWPGNIRELNHVLGWCAARSGAHGELDAAVLLRCLDQTRLADPEESDDESETQPKSPILLGGGGRKLLPEAQASSSRPVMVRGGRPRARRKCRQPSSGPAETSVRPPVTSAARDRCCTGSSNGSA